MITREQVLKDLEEIFKEQDLSDDPFVADEMFYNLGMNSLDEVEFMMAIESKYGISFPDDVANKIKKPVHYVDLIMEAVNQEAPKGL